MVYLFFKKRQVSHEQVRDLTQQEIKEFFEGRPELFSEFRAELSEQTDVLPYNNDYELSVDDIEYRKTLRMGSFG